MDHVNPLLFKNAGYDPIKDFTPISLVGSSPAMLVVGADQPYQTVDELVSAARAEGARISYGSSGHGGSSHLTGELLKKQIGVDSIQHIPYKGNAPAVQDLIGGQISFMFYPVSAIAELLNSKRLRALATTASERDPSFPEVPTMQELGYSGFEYSHPWVGMVGPAGIPPAVVEKLSASIQEAVASGKLRELLVNSASTPIGNSAAEFAEFLVSDTQRWGALIEDAGIEPQ